MFLKTQQEQTHLATCPIRKSMGESLRAPEELEVAILKSSEKLIRALEPIYAELGNQMLEVNVFKQFLAERERKPPRRAQGPPRRAQRAPRRARKPPRRAQRVPRRAQKPPKRTQELPREFRSS